MRRLVTILALGVVLLPSIAHAQSAAALVKVPVFVTSIGAVNGFTDPNKNTQDTMKDLRDALKAYKALTLVESREAAVIVLVVLDRETANLTAGVFGGAARDRSVRVKFVYKDLETELSGSAQGGTLASGGAWGKAAGKVAKQVNEWVAANRERLAQ